MIQRIGELGNRNIGETAAWENGPWRFKCRGEQSRQGHSLGCVSGFVAGKQGDSPVPCRRGSPPATRHRGRSVTTEGHAAVVAVSALVHACIAHAAVVAASALPPPAAPSHERAEPAPSSRAEPGCKRAEPAAEPPGTAKRPGPYWPLTDRLLTAY